VNLTAAGRDRSLLKRDPVRPDVHHSSEMNDILDAPQSPELGLAHGGAPVHSGLDGWVKPDKLPAGFEPAEEIAGVGGLSCGLKVERHPLYELGEELERLLEGPVEEPGARVHGGLATADDRISAGWPGRPDQIIDGDQA
jgi:hypothetical protein